jgi:hypothetical protein
VGKSGGYIGVTGCSGNVGLWTVELAKCLGDVALGHGCGGLVLGGPLPSVQGGS